MLTRNEVKIHGDAIRDMVEAYCNKNKLMYNGTNISYDDCQIRLSTKITKPIDSKTVVTGSQLELGLAPVGTKVNCLINGVQYPGVITRRIDRGRFNYAVKFEDGDHLKCRTSALTLIK